MVNPAYTILRNDIINCVPANAKKILDVGCSIGTLGKALKKRQEAYVVGIELDEIAAEEAKKQLDKVIVGTADGVDLAKEKLPKKFFDCIIYGDVLEHCIDPWAIVKIHRAFLADDGVIIASVPNVRHFTVILNLLAGEFPYRERGIMDKSHLRWFTKKSLNQLFVINRFEVITFRRNYRLIEKNINGKAARGLNFGAKYVATILFPLKDFLAFQYIVTCKKRLP